MVKVLDNEWEDDVYSLLEMAYVGRTDSNIDIYIFTNDSGKVPHFHFKDLDKKRDNLGAIRFDRPEYFVHGKYKATLNSKQRKDLIEFLNEIRKNKRYSGTNWNFLVDMWNVNNSDVELNEDIEMPDYTKLS